MTRLPALVAGSANIGDVDIASLPNEGQQTMANSISVAVASDQSAVPVSAASLPLPAGASTSANQTTANTSLSAIESDADAIRIATQLIDDPVQVLGTDTYTEATSKGMTLGAVRRDADTTLVGTTNEFGPLQMDANGRLKVESFSGETLPVSLASTTITGTVAVTQSGTWDEVGINDSGNSITVDGTVGISGAVDTELPAAAAISAENTAAPTAPSVYGFGLVFDGTNWDRQAGTSADGTLVNLGANNDVTVTSMSALVAGSANIGDVDVLTLPNVTLAAGTNTNEVVGDVAHDAAAAGNPVLLAGIAQDTDDTAPPNAVSAEGDATRLATNRDGALHVLPHGPRVWSYHENSASTLTDTSVKAAPGAGLSLYVTDIVVSLGAATALNVLFEEGTTTTVLGPFYLEAVSGRGLAIQFRTPKKLTANTALSVTTSAAVLHSIEVLGYTAAG